MGHPRFYGQAQIGQFTLELSRFDEQGRECSSELERVKGGEWITYHDGVNMHAGKVGMAARKNTRMGTVSIMIQRAIIEEALSRSDESTRVRDPVRSSERGEITSTSNAKERSAHEGTTQGEPARSLLPSKEHEWRGKSSEVRHEEGKKDAKSKL